MKEIDKGSLEYNCMIIQVQDHGNEYSGLKCEEIQVVNQRSRIGGKMSQEIVQTGENATNDLDLEGKENPVPETLRTSHNEDQAPDPSKFMPVLKQKWGKCILLQLECFKTPPFFCQFEM